MLSVAQTTQLIQLILNSTLVMAVAVLWWGVVQVRQNNLKVQIETLRWQYSQSTQAGQGLVLSDLTRLRRQRHQLQVAYWLTRQSVRVMHYVLLALGGSLFSLSLRTLIQSDWLIPLALLLFVVGVGGLLLAILLVLLECHQSKGHIRPYRTSLSQRSRRSRLRLPATADSLPARQDSIAS